jgi:hypothetical protein
VRRAANKDGPHAAIVAALQAVGASVAVLEPRPEQRGLPDLLVGFKSVNTLLEIKAKDGKLSLDQETWHGCWRGDKPWVVSCVEHALVAIGAAPGAPRSTRSRAGRMARLGLLPKRGPRLVSAVKRPVNAWEDEWQR